MTDVRQLEFSFYRNNKLLGKSQFSASPGRPGVTMNSTSSLAAFAFTRLETTDPEININMMDFGNGDILEISTAESEGLPLQPIFKGEFFSKKISMDNKAQTMTISSELVHSFYMLTLMEFSGEQSFEDVLVKDFFEKIISDSNCQASLNISDEAGEIRISGRNQRGNLFRIIKEICYINDLCLSFDSNNSVRIAKKSEILARIRGMTPVQINADDIISYETSKGIPFS